MTDNILSSRQYLIILIAIPIIAVIVFVLNSIGFARQYLQTVAQLKSVIYQRRLPNDR